LDLVQRAKDLAWGPEEDETAGCLPRDEWATLCTDDDSAGLTSDGSFSLGTETEEEGFSAEEGPGLWSDGSDEEDSSSKDMKVMRKQLVKASKKRKTARAVALRGW
jgi:hypothetical protein